MRKNFSDEVLERPAQASFSGALLHIRNPRGLQVIRLLNPVSGIAEPDIFESLYREVDRASAEFPAFWGTFAKFTVRPGC